MQNRLAGRCLGAILVLSAACDGYVDNAATSPFGDEGARSDEPQVANPGVTSIPLAEFVGRANTVTGEFVIEQITFFDPLPQLQASYGTETLRTVGQAVAEPAPWCTGRIVHDRNPGSNPPDTFELWPDPASVAFAGPGGPVPERCATGDQSLYLADGVFCVAVRAMNFFGIPWTGVHTQLYTYYGGAEHAPYGLGLGTSVSTVDPETGEILPQYANLPEPGDTLALWRHGDLDANGGEATAVWTFRNAAAGPFRFSGRVIGHVAENCATATIDEDCDGRPLNGCRTFEADVACISDSDCVSSVCNDGLCADGCLLGLFGSVCENECPGGTRDPCSGRGVCDDGRTGSGSCTCDEG
jgi:hypothetical protein